MKFARAVFLVLCLGFPLLLSGQQSGSKQSAVKKHPVATSGQQTGLKTIPLSVTDKKAVEEWKKTIYDGALDPKIQGDTEFLLSLSETELLGHFRYRQRCAICHTMQSNGERPLGPLLSQKDVMGREDAVRQQILEGSARMPGFKYSIEPETIDSIIAYLKKVQPAKSGPATEIESSSLIIDRRHL